MNEEVLRGQFHQEMLRIYDECSQFGYRPTRFRQMVNRDGGWETARTLLQGETLSDGFVRLWEENRLDLTVEALVVRDPWRRLFTESEISKAARRLEEMGYSTDGTA